MEDVEKLDRFYGEVAGLLARARERAQLAVNVSMAYTYFEIGRMIIEEEQHGQERAAYGKRMGTGFAFVGRQVRITLEDDHFWGDPVFFNRILRCFVLMDIKIGKLNHQDIGQMQMYVNYYTRLTLPSVKMGTM